MTARINLLATICWVLTAAHLVGQLTIDPTFTKITAVPTGDKAATCNCAWGDYNNDGFIDLIVVNGYFGGNISINFLYRNNGDGTFTRMTTNDVGSMVSDKGAWRGAAWGDYDNDGFLELYVSAAGKKALYHNTGEGHFTRITNSGPKVTDSNYGDGVSWGDYDNDGLLDLFLATGDSGVFGASANSLYHNEGGGMFSKVTTGPIASSRPRGDVTYGGAWADFDNDGDLDLIAGGGTNKIFVFRNLGLGSFQQVTQGALAEDSFFPTYPSWGDYDNDGLLDLFGGNYTGKFRLFHNEGNGEFTNILLGNSGSTYGCWGDYGNDGHLDLFVVMGSGTNQLYHNNGDGTFSQITTGSLVNEKDGQRNSAAWGDYDNNGFLDLFVGSLDRQGNALYRYNGNSNHWITFKLAGTKSNRAAIGAKVRVKATIGGKTFWQLREISGGNGSQPDLRPHFGLSNATKANVVRIEWPSGAVQEFADVAADQILSVWEPPALSATMKPDGTCQLTITAQPNCAWRIQTSTDLQNWQTVATVTNTTAVFQHTDAGSSGAACQFYRVASE